MFIPWKVDVPMVRWPIANWVLIGVTIAISVGMFVPLNEWYEQQGPEELQALIRAINGPSHDTSAVDYFLLQPRNFHVTQLFGSVLIHADIVHLLGNMLFLFVFGNAINAKLGHWQYLALYFGIGIIEGLVWLAVGPGNPALGASGAIMGVIGAFLLLYPRNDVSVFYWWGIWARGSFELSAMWLIAIYVAFDVWGMIFSQGAGVGNLAHVAGFLTGAVTLFVILKLGWVTSTTYEENLLQVWGLTPSKAVKKQTAVEQYAEMYAQRTLARTPPRKRDDGPIPLD